MTELQNTRLPKAGRWCLPYLLVLGASAIVGPSTAFAEAGATAPVALSAEQEEELRHMESYVSTSAFFLPEAGIEPLRRGLELVASTLGRESARYGDYLHSLGGLYLGAGDMGKAESALLDALALRRTHYGPDSDQVLRTLYNLAAAYFGSSNYVKARVAIESLAQTTSAAHASDPDRTGPVSVARAYLLLGRAYALLDRPADAVIALRRAQEAWDEDPDSPELDMSNIELGDEIALKLVAAQALAGRLDEAEADLRQLITHNRVAQGTWDDHGVELLEALATCRAHREDMVDAGRIRAQIVELATKDLGPGPHVDQSRGRVAAYEGMAKHEWAMGHVAEAQRYLANARTAFEQLVKDQHAKGPWRSALEIDMWQKAGDFERLLPVFRTEIAASNRSLALNLASGTETERLAYVRSLAGETSRVIQLALQPGAPTTIKELAVATILERKGRVLDAVVDQLDLIRRSANGDDRVLIERLAEVRARYARHALRGSSSVESDAAELRKLEAEVSARTERDVSLRADVDVRAITQHLPHDTVLVELALYRPRDPAARTPLRAKLPPRYAAVLLERDTVSEIVDLGEAQVIHTLLQAHRRALMDPASRDVRATAAMLSAKLYVPLARRLGRKRLIFAPDDQLNLLPFETLVDADGYLLNQHAIQYVTTARDVLRWGQTRPPTSRPVVVGGPAFDAPLPQIATGAPEELPAPLMQAHFPALPGTREEAAAVASLFPGAQVLVDDKATKEALLALHGPRVLHVATHGFFLDAPSSTEGTRGLVLEPARPRAAELENPLLRAGIALAGANAAGAERVDGLMTALEVANLDLVGTSFVVLSACETGLGEVSAGDGVFGLRRALMFAGAETQLMTLWKVDDEATRRLMVDYYARLAAGADRAEALRDARLALASSSRYAHPYYWSSFILSGETRPIAPKVHSRSKHSVRGCACDLHAPGSRGTGWILALGVWWTWRLRRKRGCA